MMLPRHLWLLAAIYCVASLAHFAHNAEALAAYPNLPHWLTRGQVYGAWLAVTAVGLGALAFARAGRRRTAALLLAAYGALGLYGLAHYALAPIARHSPPMNATILSEAATGLVLAVAACVFLATSRRPRTLP